MLLAFLSLWMSLNWTIWGLLFLFASDEQVLELRQYVNEWRERGTLPFALIIWVAMGLLGVFVFIAAALDLWFQKRKERRTL